MKASIDRETCIGCGACESLCPGVFKLDGKNISTVIVAEIPNDLEETALEARDNCPVSAITVE